VQHERIALEATSGLELFIAPHGIVHAVDLHLANAGFECLLDVDVEPGGRLLGNGDAADAISDLHELVEGETVVGLEVGAAVEQRGKDGPNFFSV
jgi:hypothetical protein